MSEDEVRRLGDRIGYGHMMHLATKIWDAKVPGGAFTLGPCSALMVPCPHEGKGPVGCSWCCGAQLITKRVLRALQEADVLPPSPDYDKCVCGHLAYEHGGITGSSECMGIAGKFDPMTSHGPLPVGYASCPCMRFSMRP